MFKMLRLLVLTVVVAYLFHNALAQDEFETLFVDDLDPDEDMMELVSMLPPETTEDVIPPENEDNLVDTAIKDFETNAALVKENLRTRVSKERTKNLINSMIKILDNLVELVKEKYNNNKFIELKGIERCVFPNMKIENYLLKRELLNLTKTTLASADLEDKKKVSLDLIDYIFDIIHNEGNIKFVVDVMDILYYWLPGNPGAQMIFLKKRGLEKIYFNMQELDINVIQALLELFTKVLNEHKVANNALETNPDDDSLRQYSDMNLFKQLDDHKVCFAFLKIFEHVSSRFKHNNHGLKRIVDILQSVDGFCVNHYVGRGKPMAFFKNLLKLVTDETNKEKLEYLNLDVTEITSLINKYMDNIRIDKTEL